MIYILINIKICISYLQEARHLLDDTSVSPLLVRQKLLGLPVRLPATSMEETTSTSLPSLDPNTETQSASQNSSVSRGHIQPFTWHDDRVRAASRVRGNLPSTSSQEHRQLVSSDDDSPPRAVQDRPILARSYEQDMESPSQTPSGEGSIIGFQGRERGSLSQLDLPMDEDQLRSPLDGSSTE